MKPATRAVVLSSLLGLAIAWVCFDLLVWAYGEAPRTVLGLLARGTWGNPYGVGQVLFKATPLLFTGVAVDVALRAGLFNIGGEGQLMVAALAVGVAGARLPAGVSPWVAVPLLTVLAAAVGAAWAAIPALLRARLGAHEVIGTLMFNGIAGPLVTFVLGAGFALPGTVRTVDIPVGARLLPLGSLFPALRGSAASLAFVVALAFTALSHLAFARLRVAREAALVGQNPVACGRAGIPVARRLGGALLVSGAVAGAGALGTVLGYKGYFEAGLGAGAGFGGIAVALLGRGHPIGMVMAAILLGTLQQGGLAINALVPMDLVDVLEGVVILGVALSDARVRAALARRPSAEGAR